MKRMRSSVVCLLLSISLVLMTPLVAQAAIQLKYAHNAPRAYAVFIYPSETRTLVGGRIDANSYWMYIKHVMTLKYGENQWHAYGSGGSTSGYHPALAGSRSMCWWDSLQYLQGTLNLNCWRYQP